MTGSPDRGDDSMTDNPHGEPSEHEARDSGRLFIALAMPSEVREQLADLTTRLQKGAQFTSCRPAWVDPASIHLTLAFLGTKALADVPTMGDTLRRITARYGPLRFQVRRLGVFPSWRQPKVLWVGARERTHQLLGLRKDIEMVMVRFGYEPDPRPFHPHLTLARFKSAKGVAMLEPIVAAHQAFDVPSFPIEAVTLFRSVLHGTGAVHTPLEWAPLTGEPPVRETPPSEEEQEDEQ